MQTLPASHRLNRPYIPSRARDRDPDPGWTPGSSPETASVDWFTTFPFPVFGEGWEHAMPDAWPHRGDTVVGNDVWIGYAATIMPGVEIGNGAIVATRSVVTRAVPPFAIVGGNPAELIRFRFDDQTRRALTEIAWWDWEITKITRHVKAICSNDLDALRSAS